MGSSASAASAASKSSSKAASATSEGAAAAASLPAARVSPDGGGSLLADPGGPGGRLGPLLGWWLEDASSPFSGLALKILDLSLEHVD